MKRDKCCIILLICRISKKLNSLSSNPSTAKIREREKERERKKEGRKEGRNCTYRSRAE
jgi:hypothetical protein